MLRISPESAPSTARRLAANAAIGLVLLAALGVAGLAFAWPWLPQPPPGGASLARYAPLSDGGAQLADRTNARGDTLAWVSQNYAVIPSLSVYTDLRAPQRDAITRFYAGAAPSDATSTQMLSQMAAAGAQVIVRRERDVDAAGAVTATESLLLRERTGEYLVDYYNPDSQRDLLFDPPLLSLPSDLHAGSSWQSAGVVGALGYGYQARAEQATGRGDDCLRIDDRLVVTSTQTSSVNTGTTWLCAGVGVVEAQTFDSGGQLSSRDISVGDVQARARPGALPPASPRTTAAAALAVAPDWRLLPVARALESGKADNSTIAPVWIAAEPPLLLAAGYNGDLMAFRAGDAPGEVAWRFHAGGNVYGRPAFDAQRGRIYFGAADKRLYALDTHGVFLWSFMTGDNVAGRPAVAGDEIIFGSEDRNLYALDAATGALRWRVPTGGAVVSEPALFHDSVIAGSDDGGLYALDLASGAQRWLYTAKRAIEAPVVVAGDTVLAASRDGALAAVDARSGDELWSLALDSPLRTAPAVDDALVYVVDEGGTLSAVKRADGKLAWRSAAGLYAGAPLLSADALIVAGQDGKVYALGRDGATRKVWADADAAPFEFGPVAGGGKVWLADRASEVWQLAPAEAGTLVMRLVWTDEVQRAPFLRAGIAQAPAAWQGQALVVDQERNLYLVDPATGRAVQRGVIAGSEAPTAGPVVEGDVLVVAEGSTLQAARPDDGAALWEFTAADKGYLPPISAGDTLLWATQQSANSLDNPGTLHALDRATGARKWEAPIGGLGLLGGMAVRDGIVYLSTPPSAYDVATGKQRWQANVRGIAYGGVALNAAGDTLYVAAVAANQSDGLIVALDAASGAERWRHTIAGEYLSLAFEAVLLDKQTLVVPLASHALLGLDAADGTQRWRYAPEQPPAGPAALGEGFVFMILQNAHIVAVDTRSGKPTVTRAYEANLGNLAVHPRPLVLGGRLIVPAVTRLLGLTLEQ